MEIHINLMFILLWKAKADLLDKVPQTIYVIKGIRRAIKALMDVELVC